MLQVVIIDDEPLAREGLAQYVREVDFLELVGLCENPVDLIGIQNKQRVDLIFLDIQMPKMNGIDFLKIQSKPPMVIITTAYPSYALEGYRLNVLDYLLKPVPFERFVQAVHKAKEQHVLLHPEETRPQTVPNDHFFVKCDHKFEKIFFEDILYIQGMQNYVAIHTVKGQYVTLLNLKDISEKLDPNLFIRIHKSYIISISKINSVESHEIRIGDAPIPLSKNYREAVIQKVVQGKLWKK